MSADVYPKRLKILNLDYDLVWVNRDIETATDSHGSCDTSTQTIVVCRDQKPTAMADTIWHEINHALFAGLHMTGELTEERIVTLMTSGQCTVMRDNPDFVKWMLKKLNSATR